MMYEQCIENFLKSYDPSHVERHSDSSDFEDSSNVPAVGFKYGNHSLLMDQTRFDKPEKDFSVYHACSESRHYSAVTNRYEKDRTSLVKHRKNKRSNMKSKEPVGEHQRNRSNVTMLQTNNRNRGDQSTEHLIKSTCSKSVIRNKIIPCLSTIFKRPQYCNKRTECIEEDRVIDRYHCDKPHCPCKRQRLSKRKERRGQTFQPVYAVNQNMHRFPIPKSVQPVALSKVNVEIKNGYSEMFSENNYNTSSESETEINEKHENIKDGKVTTERLKKELRKEQNSNNLSSRSQQQQFPSKSLLKSPYQILTSTSCQAKCVSIESIEFNKSSTLSPTAPEFWDFIAEKLKFQVEQHAAAKPCDCLKIPLPCSPATCGAIKATNESPSFYKIGKTSSGSFELNKVLEQDSSLSKMKNLKMKSANVTCDCRREEKKKKKKSGMTDAQIQDDDIKPCQKAHDTITKAIAQKYNGEILCIHNPPCVLINGCLNLPPPISAVQGNLWPVTQTKKSSFVQMCRKMKRSKEKKSENEQSSQYHPPYADIKQCIPGVFTEKIIQSVCYHNPPCEMVHGCYKHKYDPKLTNSCIHVPSCDKMPECLYDKTNVCQTSACVHNPRCVELPICSRKYIQLIAKENASTQVKPTSKICRHEPPCFMMPKCLAQAIRGDYIPLDAIPACTHQPSCDMIPACCRKSAKDMVSVPSQYPNTSCRIV